MSGWEIFTWFSAIALAVSAVVIFGFFLRDARGILHLRRRSARLWSAIVLKHYAVTPSRTSRTENERSRSGVTAAEAGCIVRSTMRGVPLSEDLIFKAIDEMTDDEDDLWVLATMTKLGRAKFKDLYHHMAELEQLHPRQGNPGAPEHNGDEHPHDVGGDGLAC